MNDADVYKVVAMEGVLKSKQEGGAKEYVPLLAAYDVTGKMLGWGRLDTLPTNKPSQNRPGKRVNCSVRFAGRQYKVVREGDEEFIVYGGINDRESSTRYGQVVLKPVGSQRWTVQPLQPAAKVVAGAQDTKEGAVLGVLKDEGAERWTPALFGFDGQVVRLTAVGALVPDQRFGGKCAVRIRTKEGEGEDLHWTVNIEVKKGTPPCIYHSFEAERPRSAATLRSEDGGETWEFHVFTPDTRSPRRKLVAKSGGSTGDSGASSETHQAAAAPSAE